MRRLEAKCIIEYISSNCLILNNLKMKIFAIVFVFALMLFIFAIVLGGPTSPLPMASINRPFKSVDFSDLPVLRNYISKDGVVLTYRHYEQVNKALIGSVILIHGSSGSCKSMHVLAKAFAEAGFSAYAVDVRGYGASGKKGTISYIGQLEDDLDAFSQVISLRSPATLFGWRWFCITFRRK